MSLSVENVFNAINKNKKGLEINIVQTNKYIQNIESLQVKKPIKNNEKPISIDSSTHMEDNKHYFKTISGTVSNLPKLMNDLLESSDYYCLGVNKTNQFLESILHVVDKDYKFLSTNDKSNKIQSIFDELLNNVENYYKKFNYKSKKINKQNLIDSIIAREYNKNLIRLILDYLECNCITLDLNDMNYKILNNISEDNPMVLLISQNTSYLPILNLYGKLMENKILDSINKTFVNKTEIELSESQTGLLNIRNYLLSDLQNLAENNNLELFYTDVNNKKKKKTKQQLYDDLSNLTLKT